MSGNKVRVFGPGIEPKDNVVGEPASFTVETANAGKGKLDVTISDPKGKSVTCDIVTLKDKKTYTCEYVPKIEGKFKITVTYGGKEVTKSPFYVEIAKAADIVSKPAAKYPADIVRQPDAPQRPVAETQEKADTKREETQTTGLTPEPQIVPEVEPSTIKTSNAETSLLVETLKGAEKESPTKVFGQEPSPKSKPVAEDKLVAGLTPAKGVDPVAERNQKRKAEPSEPVVETKPKSATGSSKDQTPVFGTKPYSQPVSGLSTADEFTTDLKPKEKTDFTSGVKQTSGTKTETTKFSEKEKIPMEADSYLETGATISSQVGAFQTGGDSSAYKKGNVDVEPASGLKNEPKLQESQVTTYDDKNVSEKYQPQEKYKYEDEKAEVMTKDVSVTPLKPGQEIKGDSPPKTYKDKAESKAKETTTEKDVPEPKARDIIDVPKAKTTENLDDAEASVERLLQEEAEELSRSTTERKGETVSYLTTDGSELEVMVGGLETPLRFGETRKFNVMVQDKNATRSPCTATIHTSNGTPTNVPLEMITECFDFQVTPGVPGQHLLRVEYAGAEVPGSPFVVDVEPIDVSSVKVRGLETAIVLDETRSIFIITSGVGTKVSCVVSVITPKGFFFDLPTFTMTDGYGAYFNPSEVGPHDITVCCAGQQVPGSPFTVMVEKKSVVVRGIESLFGVK